MTTKRIQVTDLVHFESTMNHLNSRLKGVEPITWEVMGEEYCEDANGGFRRYHLVEYKFAPVIAQATVVGRIELVNGEAVTTAYSEEVSWSDLTNIPFGHCDHCNTIRPRKRVYLLLQGTQLSAIGSSCLNQFLGIPNAEQLLDWVTAAEQTLRTAEGSDTYWAGQSAPIYYSAERLMAATIFCVGFYGWVTAEKGDSLNKATTASVVESTYWNRTDPQLGEDIDAHRHKAAKAIAWLRSDQFQPSSNFEHSLRDAWQHDYLSTNNTSTLVWAYRCYERAMEKQAKAEKAVSAHVGQIKERFTVEVVYAQWFVFETAYGYNYLYRFVDKAGNVLVWKTAKFVELPEGDFTITATVKAHEEYKGEKQTKVLRVVIH